MNKLVVKLVLNALVLVTVAVLAFPIIWIVMNSFKVAADVNAYPPVFLFDPTMENYKVLFDLADADATNYGTLKVEFFKPVLNSVIIAFGAVILSLIAGVPAGYALARFEFRAKEDLAFFILGFRFAPVLLVVIPLFQVFQLIGLYDSYIGMIWVYQLITLPMMIWLSRSYVEDIPYEIEEAAAICGASKPQIIFKVVIPLLKPGLVGASLLVFLLAWHNFALGLMLSAKNAPVTVALLKLLNPGVNFYPVVSAGLVISMIVPIVLILLGQRHLERGLTFGALK
ncbi:carbohydrate ABC transporter permease [Pararhizobium sp. IMCC21322]|uniref:carbohydrate ABC transporter permease n=1 Tax=Pararhizobium sp. IMCC21322 TaxID=3067903 RepID=UPI002741981A|nr:carbohydrate ABC transporter permease [Pararhizobium sp. IMCC21322]